MVIVDAVVPRRVIAISAAMAMLPLPLSPTSATPAALSLLPPPLAPRLGSPSIALLADMVQSRPDVLHYPKWLLGTWRCSNTISQFSMPLGSALADPFVRAVAEEDVAAAATLKYLIRFMPSSSPPDEPDLGAVQDRAFNALEETQAFLGPDGGSVLACKYAASESNPHGLLNLEVSDPDEQDGTSTTSVSLRIDWAQWEASASGGAFVTSELLRQRTTRPAGMYAPRQDETSLFESITRFERPVTAADGRVLVAARNRLAEYLLPSGTSPSRARLAGSRAVTVFDYDWILEKLPKGDNFARGLAV